MNLQATINSLIRVFYSNRRWWGEISTTEGKVLLKFKTHNEANLARGRAVAQLLEEGDL